jgi:hypothetical protein
VGMKYLLLNQAVAYDFSSIVALGFRDLGVDSGFVVLGGRNDYRHGL